MRLRQLDLKKGEFDDKGLLKLTGLTALRWLSLEECRHITDVGLKDLVAPLSLHSLTYVNVHNIRGLASRSLVSQAQMPSHKPSPAQPADEVLKSEVLQLCSSRCINVTQLPIPSCLVSRAAFSAYSYFAR